jgi:LAO/AO transport system kinase
MVDRKKLEETILKKSKAGKLPCAMCFKIAEDFGISKREMGKILNEIKVKIRQCQLGCFE